MGSHDDHVDAEFLGDLHNLLGGAPFIDEPVDVHAGELLLHESIHIPPGTGPDASHPLGDVLHRDL